MRVMVSRSPSATRSLSGRTCKCSPGSSTRPWHAPPCAARLDFCPPTDRHRAYPCAGGRQHHLLRRTRQDVRARLRPHSRPRVHRRQRVRRRPCATANAAIAAARAVGAAAAVAACAPASGGSVIQRVRRRRKHVRRARRHVWSTRGSRGHAVVHGTIVAPSPQRRPKGAPGGVHSTTNAHQMSFDPPSPFRLRLPRCCSSLRQGRTT